MAFFSPKKIRNRIKTHKSCKLYKVHCINFENMSLRKEINGSKNACFVK